MPPPEMGCIRICVAPARVDIRRARVAPITMTSKHDSIIADAASGAWLSDARALVLADRDALDDLMAARAP